MKIFFDTNQTNNSNNIENATLKATDDQTKVTGSRIFDVQITGKAKDGEAYVDRGKSISEALAQSGMNGDDLQQKYMAVMSNSMSSEDFSEMMEKGYDPTNVDVETSVTILDTIKIAMAKGGTEIAGFTDTLSDETLQKAVGSESYAASLQSEANTLSKENTTELETEYTNDISVTGNVEEESTDEKTKSKEYMEALQQGLALQTPETMEMVYMIGNQLQPTIGNLYKAQFAGTTTGYVQGSGYYADATTGYYAKKADTIDIDQIADQVDQVISNAGMETTDESRKAAGFLLENGLPLTEDSLTLYTKLQDIQLPMQEDDLQIKIANAMESGKNPVNTDLSEDGTIYDQAVSILQDTTSLSQEAVDQTLSENKILNLRNLMVSQKKLEAAGNVTVNSGSEPYQNEIGEGGTNRTNTTTIQDNTLVLTTARRQLAEVQLSMTAEANLKLLQSDYQIETAPLEELVAQLKQAEQSWQTTEVAQAENAASQISNMASLPASVLGLVGSGRISFTVTSVTEAGTALQSQYEKAGQSYETLMTAPRSDLGDSIQKAFQNTDAILEDLNLESTALNERAVRILGYNQMEITEENMVKVISADDTVQNIIQKVTPGTALQMIRDGVNPLTTDMDTLDQYLNQQETEYTNETEKYSKFLYQMEQENNVTEQEKEAYIGIYRLFRQIEKSDGAAVGYLVNTGADVTLGNLLSAVRSSKHTTMDYKVDNSFAGVDTSTSTNSISDQINLINQMSYADQIWDTLSVENLKQMKTSSDTTLEEMAYHSINTTLSIEGYEEYKDTILGSSEDVISFLQNNDQQITVSNLMAGSEMLQNKGSAFRKIYQALENMSTESNDSENASEGDVAIMDQQAFDTAVNELQGSFTNQNEVQDGYQKFQAKMIEILETLEDADDTTALDIKALQAAHKQISLATGLAQEETYEVPVKINDVYTTVNLKIIHDDDKSGVAVTMQTDAFGMVGAEFEMEEDGSVTSVMTAETDDGVQYLNELNQDISDMLEEQGFSVDDISVIKVKKVSVQTEPKQQKNVEQEENVEQEDTSKQQNVDVSSVKLYQVAKAFLEIVRK